jgi:hypothetical protein
MIQQLDKIVDKLKDLCNWVYPVVKFLNTLRCK